MEEQVLDQVYYAYMGEYGEKRQTDVKNRIDWIIKQVDGNNILDIGCSQGICDILLAKKSKQVLGIDVEEESIQIANEILSKENESVKNNVKFIVCDFIEYDFKNQKFDTILITEVLEHLENPISFLEKAAELLQENGKIIITVPFGINRSPGHVRTYYFIELYEQLSKYFKLENYVVLGNWIGFICNNKQDAQTNIQIDTKVLYDIETGFFNIESPLRDKNEAQRERIIKINDNLSALKERLDTAKVKLEATKMLYTEQKEELKEKTREIEKQKKQLAVLDGMKKELKETKEFCTEQKQDIIQKTNELENQKQQIHELINEMENQKQQAHELTNELENQKQQAHELTNELENQKQQAHELTNELTALNEAMESLKKTLKKRQQKLNALQQDINETKTKLSVVNKNYSDLSNSKLGKMQLWYWRTKNGNKSNPQKTNKVQTDTTITKANPVQTDTTVIKENTVTEVLNNSYKQILNEDTKTMDKEMELKVGNVILFMATNGAGLGHITRSLAIAKRIREMDCGKEVIFLTTSIALNIVAKEGFAAYHIPPKELLGEHVDKRNWGILLKNALDEIFSLYNISTVVFDGAYPYAQFVNGIKKRNGLTKVWVKRGGEKGNTCDARKLKEADFDYIVVPGEAGEKIEAQDKKHIMIPPVIFIEKEELLDREDVRTFFKVKDHKKLVYVQLGAGNINDINSQISKVIGALRKRKDIMIVLGESIIGKHLNIFEEDVCIIKDYPNSRYFKGFDFVISACGYNSFHELLYLEVPAIYIPNMETKTDDQYGRAMLAQNAGAALVVTDLDNIEQAIEKISDEEENKRMRVCANALKLENGAKNAAKFIIDRI